MIDPFSPLPDPTKPPSSFPEIKKLLHPPHPFPELEKLSHPKPPVPGPSDPRFYTWGIDPIRARRPAGYFKQQTQQNQAATADNTVTPDVPESAGSDKVSDKPTIVTDPFKNMIEELAHPRPIPKASAKSRLYVFRHALSEADEQDKPVLRKHFHAALRDRGQEVDAEEYGQGRPAGLCGLVSRNEISYQELLDFFKAHPSDPDPNKTPTQT